MVWIWIGGGAGCVAFLVWGVRHLLRRVFDKMHGGQ
jgi:hypothetical protein